MKLWQVKHAERIINRLVSNVKWVDEEAKKETAKDGSNRIETDLYDEIRESVRGDIGAATVAHKQTEGTRNLDESEINEDDSKADFKQLVGELVDAFMRTERYRSPAEFNREAEEEKAFSQLVGEVVDAFMQTESYKALIEAKKIGELRQEVVEKQMEMM